MKIAPSILSADFGNLEKSINRVTSAEWLHVDVMDGHFVPNITIGPVVVNGLRKYTKQILDVHLMITNPSKYIKAFSDAGSDYITFHYEVKEDIKELIHNIKALDKKVGISIKPNTDVLVLEPYLHLLDLVLIMSVEPGFGGQSFIPNAVDKIKYLSEYKQSNNLNYEISVDGGINEETGTLCKEAGVTVLVAGSYIFNAEDPEERIKSLR